MNEPPCGFGLTWGLRARGERARDHYAPPFIDLQSNSVSGGKRLKRFVEGAGQVLDAQRDSIARANEKAARRRLLAELIPERGARVQNA
jgi:hypothetical protein